MVEHHVDLSCQESSSVQDVDEDEEGSHLTWCFLYIGQAGTVTWMRQDDATGGGGGCQRGLGEHESFCAMMCGMCLAELDDAWLVLYALLLRNMQVKCDMLGSEWG